MSRGACLLALALPMTATPVTFTVRGRSVELTYLDAGTRAPRTSILFLPGDGGWRGKAIEIARMMTAWGYGVYGFDTRRYLEMFSAGGARLSQQDIAADICTLADQVSMPAQRAVVLVGWSQGASMAVAAVSGCKSRSPIRGVITLGLPETGVLGWDWKASIAVAAHRDPAQPTFAVKPLLPASSPVPLWLIHGSEDEYTALGAARILFRSAGEPKHLEEIRGANHRFDGHREELAQSLQRGLAWIAAH